MVAILSRTQSVKGSYYRSLMAIAVNILNQAGDKYMRHQASAN